MLNAKRKRRLRSLYNSQAAACYRFVIYARKISPQFNVLDYQALTESSFLYFPSIFYQQVHSSGHTSNHLCPPQYRFLYEKIRKRKFRYELEGGLLNRDRMKYIT